MKINLLELEISSKFKFQIMFLACALIHTTFLIVFSLLQIYILMTFNVFSVSFYVVGAFAVRSGNFEKHSLAWITGIYSEITLHAVVCTIHLGYGSYFFIYAIVALSVSSYMLFMACDKERFTRSILIFLLMSVLSIAVCQIYLRHYLPVYTHVFDKELTDSATNIMRLVNLTFGTVSVFAFSLLFVIEMNTLIRKLNNANEKMSYVALHDSLTGLKNRHSVRKFFENLLDGSGEYCVILGDIDNFKKVNDTYGHDCGDDVLIMVSNVIKDSVSENELACRWGGEEILLVMLGDKKSCLERMKKIRSRINESYVQSGERTVKVTMTFGFADSSEVENIAKSRVDAIVTLVDSRLYTGKKSGKNVIIDYGFYEEA